MATSGVMNGTLMQVKYVTGAEGTATILNLQTECSISVSMDTRDITTKGSGGYRALLGGLRQGSMSTTVLHDMDETTTNGLADFMAAMADNTSARGACSLVFTTGVVGDDQFTTDAILTTLDISAGVEDNVSISLSFEFSGTLTFNQVTA